MKEDFQPFSHIWRKKTFVTSNHPTRMTGVNDMVMLISTVNMSVFHSFTLSTTIKCALGLYEHV